MVASTKCATVTYRRARVELADDAQHRRFRVLELAARFADVWTPSRLSLDEFGERSQMLDTMLDQNSRRRDTVKRASMDQSSVRGLLSRSADGRMACLWPWTWPPLGFEHSRSSSS